jgi:putative transposase
MPDESTTSPMVFVFYNPRGLAGHLALVMPFLHAGQTRETRLCDDRAAPRFLTKALRRHGIPETIAIDGSEANAAAIRGDNEAHSTAIIIRQVPYLQHVVAQAHRGVTRVTRPMLDFKAFVAAQGTLVGIELRHMLKPGQQVVEDGGARLTAAAQFYALAASSSTQQGSLDHPSQLATDPLNAPCRTRRPARRRKRASSRRWCKSPSG